MKTIKLAVVQFCPALGRKEDNFSRMRSLTDDIDADIMVFHAGTRRGNSPAEVVTSGGRVLTVVATGKSIAQARQRVYDNISRIDFAGGHYRQDIARLKEG